MIGELLSFPYMVLFYAVWLVASLCRPVTLACWVAAFTTKPLAVWRKLLLLKTAIYYLLFCNDKTNWKAKDDPQAYFPTAAVMDRADAKSVVFVRHGESTWNDTFNRGDRSKLVFVLGFIPNLIKALYYEIYFFVSGQDWESWFFDSPLSEKGCQQAMGIHSHLSNVQLQYETPKEQEFLNIMLGNAPSQLVSSNLRRAISTMAIGFQSRLLTESDEHGEGHDDDDDDGDVDNKNESKSHESLIILPQLQEMSRNPDAQCITPAKGKVRMTWTDPPELQPIYESSRTLDTTFHTGNKAVDSNGLERMRDFCRVTFEDIAAPAVVAGGHSLYFRNFFQTFLPHHVQHVCKKKKIKNGGCVGFTLLRIPNEAKGYQYMIDPQSITVLYGGF